MKGIFHALSCIGLMWLAGCQGDPAGSVKMDLDGIQTVQDLRDAEKALDDTVLNKPDQDFTGAYSSLAGKAMSLSRLLDAERLYQKALWGDKESPDRQSSLQALSELYRNRLRFVQVGQMICCAFNPEGSDCCPEDSSEPDSLQVVLRQEIVADSTGAFSRQAGREYIAFAQSHALLYPDRSTSPGYLNEAAKLALSMRMPSKGIELYQWIYIHFPDSEAAPKAMFLEAFTYENELRDLESARKAYEAYLQQFPNDIFAKDARILLDNLGVDPEEMIRRFQAQ